VNEKMIKVAVPNIGDEEIEVAVEVLKSGNYVSGKWVEAFEEAFASYIGTEYAVACNSGTSALHLALLSLGIGKGDGVIVPSLTFFATVQTVLYVGATPIFADIDEDTYCMDMEDVNSKINRKTKAIIPVHLFGHAMNFEKASITINIIEDSAQAHGTQYKGWRVGSLGKFGCFSFYATKNMTVATEGGMITTNDRKLAEKMKFLRSHGMIDRNTHEFLGYNYRMNEIAGAIGLVQLQKLDEMNARRQEIADYYNENLKASWLKKPIVKDYCTRHAWFWYACLVDEEKLGMSTDKLRKVLLSEGVETRHRYNKPLYHQPILSRSAMEYFGDAHYVPEPCPIAEKVCGKLIGLPIGSHLSMEDLEKVVEVVNGIRGGSL